ncbi:uncharacterized protein LOC135154101 [Lytechinus pictus]|uniref:uncharacterized protein LOC135154101 n=1 Tax=Lytechinus pictus TaxID=7653 RepID=UPI0030B9AF6C
MTRAGFPFKREGLEGINGGLGGNNDGEGGGEEEDEGGGGEEGGGGGREEITDKVIEARRPDIVLLKKKEKECLIIDIAIPGDCRAWRKEEEKIQKYNDLAWELRRIWKVKTKVVPIVIGALGTVTSRHISFLAVL